MLFFLRWLDGEENAADTRTSSAPLPSLSPMEVSNLERHRELAVQSKGPSQEVTGSDLDYFGKWSPGETRSCSTPQHIVKSFRCW